MKYDDATWHCEGNFPAGLHPDHGATPIGMYLGWAILRDLVGDLHRLDEERAFDLDRVKNRHLRPRDFVLNWSDGMLTTEDLNPEGNAFAEAYYRDLYLADWDELFPDRYRIDDTWENFDRVVAILDWRFDSWREGILKQQVGEVLEELVARER